MSSRELRISVLPHAMPDIDNNKSHRHDRHLRMQSIKLGEKTCITLADDFQELILNKKVLHLVSYSVNKKGCIKETKTEEFYEMLRYTAYRSFFNILELKGLGKNRRYGLPACVMAKIRNQYPSATGKYKGFHPADDETESGSQTLRVF
jgi:hypothetical protein